MRRLLISWLLSLVLMLPAMAAEHTVQVEFVFVPPSDKTVSGYRLYADGAPACAVPVGPGQVFDCAINVTDGSHLFTMTAVYADDTESPLSPPYEFAIHSAISSSPKRGGLLRINGTTLRLIATPQ